MRHASFEGGTLCHPDGEDLAQAFLLEALRGDFDDRAVPSDKAMAFAKAVLRSRARSAAQLRGLHTAEGLTEMLPCPEAGPDVQLERAGLRRFIAGALKGLSKTLRKAVIRRHLQGRSVVEIAGLERVTTDVIRQRLVRGRRKARQVLGLQDQTRQ